MNLEIKKFSNTIDLDFFKFDIKSHLKREILWFKNNEKLLLRIVKAAADILKTFNPLAFPINLSMDISKTYFSIKDLFEVDERRVELKVLRVFFTTFTLFARILYSKLEQLVSNVRRCVKNLIASKKLFNQNKYTLSGLKIICSISSIVCISSLLFNSIYLMVLYLSLKIMIYFLKTIKALFNENYISASKNCMLTLIKIEKGISK